MVWKWEGSYGESDVVRDNAVLPLGSHKLVNDWVEGEAVRAEEVLEELDCDAVGTLALGPSWVCSIDWS